MKEEVKDEEVRKCVINDGGIRGVSIRNNGCNVRGY